MSGRLYSQSVLRRLRDDWDGLCFYCRKELKDGFRFDGRLLQDGSVTIDHLKPLSRGGKNKIDNFVFCCALCNKDKGSRTLVEYVAFKEAKGNPLPIHV